MDIFQIIPSIIGVALAIATPLILTSMAGLFCERSGVVDIGLEGKLNMSAFAAALSSYFITIKWGLPMGAVVGIMAGMFASFLMSLAHAYACVSKSGDQVVSGVAINFFATGFTIVVTRALFGSGDTPPIKVSSGTFGTLFPSIDGSGILINAYNKMIANQNILTWVALALIPIIWWILYRTRFGLRLRAVGENPQAVDTAGMSVKGLRYKGVLIGGLLCGMAGTYLSLGSSSLFIRDMAAGRGYIALVVLILGRWRPIPTLLGCLLFGILQASSDYLPLEPVLFGISLGNLSPIMNSLPYILVLILMIFIGRSVAPAASGVPYKKER
ncbi:MAG: ABC transporter permease [Alphaproteobacteria bacterium]